MQLGCRLYYIITHCSICISGSVRGLFFVHRSLRSNPLFSRCLLSFASPSFHLPASNSPFPTRYTMNGYYDPQQHQSTNIEIPQGPTNQPRLLLRNLNETDATFHLSGVELAYANSLRRVMMADVPTIGSFS